MLSIQVQKNELLEGLRKVEKAITGKPSMEILSGIKVVLEGTTIKLMATDIDFSVISKVRMASIIEVSGEFVICDGGLFIKGVSKMAEGIINLDVDGSDINISNGRTEFSTKIVSPEGYPKFPEIGESQNIKLNAEDFKKMVSITTYCAPINEQSAQKPILIGAKLDVKDGFMTMVALDGLRLALSQKRVDSSLKLEAVIPASGLNTVQGIMTNKQPLEILIGANHVVIKDSETEATLRLLEGDYIQYDRLVNQATTKKAVMNTSELREALDMASIIKSKDTKDNLVKLYFQPFGDKMKLNVLSDSDVAKTKKNLVELESYEGEPLNIAFNVNFLQDALKRISSQSVLFDMNTNTSAILIKPIAEDNIENLHLILPVRILNF